MQQRFLLQILLLAQHVSDTTMPIIRSSRVLYSGCCLWYFVLWFSSCWSAVELRVICPVCRMLQHPANLKTTARNTTGSNHCIILELLMMGIMVPTSISQTEHITLSSTPDQQLENHNTKYHRQQPLYNTLELLMMGIVVPETC